MSFIHSHHLISFVFFLMIRRPPRSTLDRSSAASDVYKRQDLDMIKAAGLGIAYRAKPLVAAEADAQLDHMGLDCLLYTSPSPRDRTRSRMPSSA